MDDTRPHLPLATAPKDGTLVRLLVRFTRHPMYDSDEPLWTIGTNTFEFTEVDQWNFPGWSWSQDCFTNGLGEPIGWLPFFDDRADALAEAVSPLRDVVDNLTHRAKHGGRQIDDMTKVEVRFGPLRKAVIGLAAYRSLMFRADA